MHHFLSLALKISTIVWQNKAAHEGRMSLIIPEPWLGVGTELWTWGLVISRAEDFRKR